MPFLGWLTHKSKSKKSSAPPLPPFPFGKDLSIDNAYSYDYGRSFHVRSENGYRGILWQENLPPPPVPALPVPPPPVIYLTSPYNAGGFTALTGVSQLMALPPVTGGPEPAGHGHGHAAPAPANGQGQGQQGFIPPNSPVLTQGAPFPPPDRTQTPPPTHGPAHGNSNGAGHGAYSTRSAAAPLPPFSGNSPGRSHSHRHGHHNPYGHSQPSSTSSSIIPLPPVSTLASIHPDLAVDPQSTNGRPLQCNILWDTSHLAHYASLRGALIPEIILQQPLFPFEPQAGSTKVRIKVEHLSGAHYGKFEVSPGRDGSVITLRDILEGVQAAFRIPLNNDEIEELGRNGTHGFVMQTMQERLQDPCAIGAPTVPIKVDVLNAERFLRGVQVGRWSRSLNGYVLKLIVGPRT